MKYHFKSRCSNKLSFNAKRVAYISYISITHQFHGWLDDEDGLCDTDSRDLSCIALGIFEKNSDSFSCIKMVINILSHRFQDIICLVNSIKYRDCVKKLYRNSILHTIHIPFINVTFQRAIVIREVEFSIFCAAHEKARTVK